MLMIIGERGSRKLGKSWREHEKAIEFLRENLKSGKSKTWKTCWNLMKSRKHFFIECKFYFLYVRKKITLLSFKFSYFKDCVDFDTFRMNLLFLKFQWYQEGNASHDNFELMWMIKKFYCQWSTLTFRRLFNFYCHEVHDFHFHLVIVMSHVNDDFLTV